MEIRLSEAFLRDYERIRDKSLRLRVNKALLKLKDNPEVGKPLKYGYKGNRTLRVSPFRIFYRLEGSIIRVTGFEHRDRAYGG
jgi:mRNA-degrading endonuclease RelE of RelBE toxin-antitoxin system